MKTFIYQTEVDLTDEPIYRARREACGAANDAIFAVNCARTALREARKKQLAAQNRFYKAESRWFATPSGAREEAARWSPAKQQAYPVLYEAHLKRKAKYAA